MVASRRKVAWLVEGVQLTGLGSHGGVRETQSRGRRRLASWKLSSLRFAAVCCLFSHTPPSVLTDRHEASLLYTGPQGHGLGLPYSHSLSLQESTGNIKSAYILWQPSTSVSSDFSEPFG